MREMKLLEKFFNEYFAEVLEHLDYEDTTAFPYFITLLEEREQERQGTLYSSKEYGDHHTDIELKLQDLKNLLLKYVEWRRPGCAIGSSLPSMSWSSISIFTR